MDKKQQIERLKALIKRRYPDIELDNLDLEALVDSALTLKENASNILRGYRAVPTKRESKHMAEAAQAHAHEQYIVMLRDAESQAQAEIEAQVEGQQSELLDKAFDEASQIIGSLAASSDVHGMIFEGPPGLGKTTCVEQTLVRRGLKLNDNFMIVNGYLTPLKLFECLWSNNGKIIVFDDIMKMFENDINRGFLQAALWNPTGVRRIDYGSTSPKLQAPPSFQFTGKIIWCVNHFPKQFEALKSRVFHYTLDLSYAEKIKLCYEIARLKGFPQEIPEFIYEQTKSCGQAYAIDFRLLFKLNALRLAGADWKTIGIKLFSLDADVFAIVTTLQQAGTVKQACALFQEQTGKSRATFYRMKAKLEEVSKSHEKGI